MNKLQWQRKDFITQLQYNNSVISIVRFTVLSIQT